MNEENVDARLKLLFAEPPPAPDPAFGDRVILLAGHAQTERQVRRRAAHRLASEALALIAVLAAFTALALIAPVAADLGDTIPLASPAMFGLAMLGIWVLVATRPAVRGR